MKTYGITLFVFDAIGVCTTRTNVKISVNDRLSNVGKIIKS